MNQEDSTKAVLQQLDEYDFEKFIADLWEEQGWETRVLQASKDKGIDIEARRTDPLERKNVIQTKRYSEGNNIGSEKIQQYSSLQIQEDNVDSVIIVTTSDFTQQAKELAPDLNIKLINGDQLIQIIKRQEAEEILEKYSGQTDSIEYDGETPQKDQLQSAETLNPNQVPDIYISKLVDNSIGKLVTKNRLAKMKSGISHPQTPTEQPILGYLYKDEQPHFTLRCNRIKISGKGSIDLHNNAYLVATNYRVFVIMGLEDRDKVITIPYREITGVNIPKLMNSRITINIGNDYFKFGVDHSRFNESQVSSNGDIQREIQNCCDFIKQAVYKLM